MSRFKVGLRFRSPSYRPELTYEIIGMSTSPSYPWRVRVVEYEGGRYPSRPIGYETDWREGGDEVIINNKSNIIMNIKEKFALAFKSEPEKSFRLAGITNGDDLLTEDGQKIFLSWMLKKHGNEFKTEVVDKLLDESKVKDFIRKLLQSKLEEQKKELIEKLYPSTVSGIIDPTYRDGYNDAVKEMREKITSL